MKNFNSKRTRIFTEALLSSLYLFVWVYCCILIIFCRKLNNLAINLHRPSLYLKNCRLYQCEVWHILLFLQGERLSHAVGCAFAACLERKLRRDKECGVTMSFDTSNSTFTRTGSFRQPTITDRLSEKQEINKTISGK